MPESMFLSAGFSAQYYTNLKYVAHDEEAHVELLLQLWQLRVLPLSQLATTTFPILIPPASLVLLPSSEASEAPLILVLLRLLPTKPILLLQALFLTPKLSTLLFSASNSAK
jgi:hypothetical protein